jgi:RNA ligase (TIGR02306 family)
MSSFTVTLETVEVRPHPNADRLELARVGFYDAVIGKGQFKTGDVVLYIPEQAILPSELIATLGLEGKLAGKAKNRIKAVSLRGALSQGIVANPSIVSVPEDSEHYTEVTEVLASVQTGIPSTYDFGPVLGIEKWVPEIPVHLSGSVESGADLLSWVDIENIKRYPGIFSEGEEVWVSEKIHGTCLVATVSMNLEENGFEHSANKVIVSSKGLADKHLALTEDSNNLYWRAVNAYKVRELAVEIANYYTPLLTSPGIVASVGIYGEVYGSGIQDLGYGAKGTSEVPGFAVFDARVKMTDGTSFWVDAELFNGQGFFRTEIPKVPTLYVGPYNIEKIATIANGMESVSGTEANIREGVVIRPAEETTSEALMGRRKIAKFVTEAYLTRKGGTEYQ